MRWQGGRRSSNVEDRRGDSPQYAAGGGGIMLIMRFLPFLLRTKFGRILLLVGVVAFVGSRMLGVDLLSLMSGGSAPQKAVPAEQNELVDFVSVVLADTEATWAKNFKQMGKTYEAPVLVLFSGAVNSACGMGQAAMGPFYCPGDHKVYIDLSFFQDLKTRHNAPGDFAQAYVIAHEVGHHVQNLLGISGQVSARQRQASKVDANALSVLLELQADCFAGLWGYSANTEREIIEAGDLDEALTAATAIGDDRLQKQGQGYVVPESFNHGTSEQRARWFKIGFKQGDFAACNTFAAKTL